MDTLHDLIAWLHRCWLEDGILMEAYEAGRFRDAVQRAADDLQRHRDDESDRGSR